MPESIREMNMYTYFIGCGCEGLMKNAEKENTTYENVKEFIQSLKKDDNRK